MAAENFKFLRTQIILENFFPPPPAIILDIGGGAEIHAFPLAEKGYQVHFLDLTPALVLEAKKRKGISLASYTVGDARALPFQDSYADVVLLFGPLYHLTDPKDRSLALLEAFRVLKPERRIFVAAVSRFASLFDEFYCQFMSDPTFVPIISQDLENGQHRNPTNLPEYFTTAFFS